MRESSEGQGRALNRYSLDESLTKETWTGVEEYWLKRKNYLCPEERVTNCCSYS